MKAATILRESYDSFARPMTLDMGKMFAQAQDVVARAELRALLRPSHGVGRASTNGPAKQRIERGHGHGDRLGETNFGRLREDDEGSALDEAHRVGP